ncbi:MAG: Gldg family protein [Thalassobaculum sp.]|uniref:GldG family protein n=1 Tax=Thalassobaculum sp. TaxID=2022740 RepID=UPI0032EAEE95
MTTPHPAATDTARRRDPARLTALALALLAVLFVAVNVLVSFTLTAQRVDLTADKLYSLSPATQRVLDAIEEPVTLRLFYSKRLGTQAPGYGIYAERVQDVLREYASLSDGKVILEIYDPTPFTPVEDRAVSFGLQQIPLEGVEGNVFFGLAGSNMTDDVETIPFLQPDREALLEYDLTKMIYALSQGASGKVGLIGSLKIDGDVRMGQTGRPEQVPPMVVAERIREVLDIETLPNDVQKIPDDIAILMVAHPKNLSPRTLFAIDQYILGGGKAAIFVDPYAESQAGPMTGGPMADAPSSTLEPIFEAWGLQMPIDKVVGDRFAARRVGQPNGRDYVSYVPWLLLRGARNLNRESPITAQIDTLAVASAGALSVKDGAAITLTPLVTSSPGSMLIDAKKLMGPVPEPEKLLREYQAGDAYVLAGMVTGTVKTAFPDGRPALADGQDDDPTAVFDTVLTESKGPIQAVVVADSDVLIDRFWVQYREFFGRRVAVPGAGNGDFVANVMDGLTGSSALLDLRGQGSSYRPFEVIEQIKREADRKYQAKEQELRETLAETQTKLDALRDRQASTGGPVALSDEERRQVTEYQRQILRLRNELREVQRSLREDVERLETKVLFANIALMPVLVAIFALALAAWRVRRRSRRSAVEA